jgi:hypothetical protein
MSGYYDDNFGEWDMEDDFESMERFYKQVQNESVEKTCSICEQKVMLRPEYDKCNTCMDVLENGGYW